MYAYVDCDIMCLTIIIIIQYRYRYEQSPGIIPPVQLQLQYHTVLYRHGTYMR